MMIYHRLQSLHGSADLCQLHLMRTRIVVAALLRADHRPAVRHLYDSRFVDNAGATITLLHNADDPRLLPVAWPAILPQCSRQTHTTGLHLCAETCRLLPWQADQQTTCRKDMRMIYC